MRGADRGALAVERQGSDTWSYSMSKYIIINIDASEEDIHLTASLTPYYF